MNDAKEKEGSTGGLVFVHGFEFGSFYEKATGELKHNDRNAEENVRRNKYSIQKQRVAVQKEKGNFHFLYSRLREKSCLSSKLVGRVMQESRKARYSSHK